MPLILLLILLVSGCAEATKPRADTRAWTPERKALADRANQAGREARARAERNANPSCNVNCQMDREYAAMQDNLNRTLPMREPLHCTSYNLGTAINTDCY